MGLQVLEILKDQLILKKINQSINQVFLERLTCSKKDKNSFIKGYDS